MIHNSKYARHKYQDSFNYKLVLGTWWKTNKVSNKIETAYYLPTLQKSYISGKRFFLIEDNCSKRENRNGLN